MSLIGKVAAAVAGPQQPRPPVPMAESGYRRLPSPQSAGSLDESFLRAYSANGTAFSNLSLLASATAGPEWVLLRDDPVDGRRYTTSDEGPDQRERVIRHAALNLLTHPNPFWSRERLFELSQLYQDLTGKAHWVTTKAMGIPTGIWPVRPDRMRPVPDPDRYLLGWLYTAPGGREQIALEPGEVIYNPLPDPVDSYNGTGRVQSVLTEIDAIRYAAQYNKNFFSNSARPDGVLSVDHRVDDDEWDELTERWREAHRGVSRAHRVAVLEGVTWVPTSTSPKDMDFSNLMTTGGDRIREALAMHKIMTGMTEDVNRANAQTGEEVFAAWQVAPRLRRWRSVLNYQFLPMFGATGRGVAFDFLYPMPVNREQDNFELKVKSEAIAALVASGYDQADVLASVGWPEMRVAFTPAPAPVPASPDVAAAQARRDRAWQALADLQGDEGGLFREMERQMAAWNSLERAA